MREKTPELLLKVVSDNNIDADHTFLNQHHTFVLFLRVLISHEEFLASIEIKECDSSAWSSLVVTGY